MTVAIEFSDVSKSFRRGSARYRSLRDTLTRLLLPWTWGQDGEPFWALRDLSFEVPAGGSLGIIGPNGSGKSTTLKLMSRITHPTTGTIRIRGRVGALIELGAGMHPELTGRENIYTYGAIMGLRAEEIRRRFDAIVEFAGLGGFLDTPLKHYSSGMQVRLGFSVASHITADILLVDEVLAVGDAAFQTKCLRRMRELRDQGVTILLVSHQLANIQRMCSETMLLLEGRIAARGPTAEVIAAYYQMLDRAGSASPEGAVAMRGVAPARGEGLSILGVRLVDGAGRERPAFEMGEDLTAIIEFAAARPVVRPQVSLSFNSSDWTVYTGADTRNDAFEIPLIHGRGRVELTIPKLGLGPGLYEVNVGLWDEELQAPYDWKWAVRRFVVNSTRNLFAGRFMLPHAWRLVLESPSPASPAPAEAQSPARRAAEESAGWSAVHLAAFQDRLHSALELFINGAFVVPGSRRSELVRPLRLSATRVPWDLFETVIGAIPVGEVAAVRVDERLVASGRSQRWLGFADAAALLAQLHGLLNAALSETAPGDRQQITVLRRYERATYLSRGLRAVDALARCAEHDLAPYVLGVYLHGSLSTLDYTGYSDLDDFVVLKRDAVLNAAALADCAAKSIDALRYLYAHDPLHHHGHYVASEIDLRSYNPAYLPPEVLRFATALYGPVTLDFTLRDPGVAHRRAASATAQQVARTNGMAPNVWGLKNLVSSVLLLPALYLETQGTYAYKKYSFDLARESLAPAWSAVITATALREQWQVPLTPRTRAARWLICSVLRNPPLFGRLMARTAPSIPPPIAERLRTDGFYEHAAALGRLVLERLDGRGDRG